MTSDKLDHPRIQSISNGAGLTHKKLERESPQSSNLRGKPKWEEKPPRFNLETYIPQALFIISIPLSHNSGIQINGKNSYIGICMVK